MRVIPTIAAIGTLGDGSALNHTAPTIATTAAIQGCSGMVWVKNVQMFPVFTFESSNNLMSEKLDPSITTLSSS
jgi:hypothetical protein